MTATILHFPATRTVTVPRRRLFHPLRGRGWWPRRRTWDERLARVEQRLDVLFGAVLAEPA